MSANPDEKTTVEDEIDKELRTENNIDTKEDLNQSSELDNHDNETRRKLRKNPKKTVLLYSAENLNKFEKKKKITPTDLKDEDIKLFKNILEKLRINPKSYYFRSSPLKQFETKEDKQIYRSIVTHPMDLSHILKKINNQKYNTYQDFYNDIVLIWDNAQLFNQVGTVFYEDADFMRTYTEKIFKEKKVDDKVVFKAKQIFEENNENNEEINNDESNNNEEDNDNSNDKNFLGKKRKNNVVDDENENEELNNLDGETEKSPIIDIKNSDIDNLEPKKKDNNKNKEKEKDTQFRKSSSVKPLQNGEKKLENILENMGDKNNSNKNKIKNKKMSEENNDSNNNISDNNKENDTNNNNNIENNKNNNIYIERYNENLRKKEEDYKWSDELIKSYSYKIAKKLDKLTDEDMFDLIEFIDTIKPEAIDDSGNLLNIDMTKFEGDTYVNVLNFVENAILKNSIYK